ncbi:succinyl-CoA synthetase alpha subunit [Seinonella peptonophila]|uniref:Succinyl-CoA synthetase alpha subunit n=1 Tax=Seinonella peptonophila TaxID=112248 RepID=A0A1M4SKN5_9BACL|nr:succinate--CoA ligase subunit alpha [Seinonella peptonophila]SHE32749.1 succinyl-CoA synthetase alpha subunit [Seinonella peptonophila]
MAILIDEKSRILIQGMTGSVGQIFAKRMLTYQTPLVAGVTPGKGRQVLFGVPIYSTVLEAVQETAANVSLVIVPPNVVKEAVFEAIDAGIKTIVIYSEGVPVHDSIRMIEYAKLKDVLVFGPNSAGVVSPRKANVSDLDDSILQPGKIGIVSKSGTLTYEVVEILKDLSFGISTIVCLGGDPVIGVQHDQILELFEQDMETEAIIYIGEIGGNDEKRSAEVIKQMEKPVFSYVAGKHAPVGKRMGHAGAIIHREDESASNKQQILKESGALVVDIITDLRSVLATYPFTFRQV